MKFVKKDEHPYEVEIATFFSSRDLASDTKNHCIPIYDVLTVPDNPEMSILVMPLVRGFDSPPFQTIGEAVDFFGQFFEVCNLTQ
jgi:serine/threonine protein kinase